MVAQGIAVRVLTLADFAGAAAQATLLLILVLAIFILLRRRVAAELGGEERAMRIATAGRHEDGLRRWPPLLESMRQAASTWLRRGGEILSLVGRPLLWIAATLSLVFLVLPLLVVIPLAFSSGAYLSFPPPGFSFRWFTGFFENRQWLEASWFSIQMASGAAMLSLLLGVPVAFAIVRRRMVGRLPLYLLLISPLVVPQVVVAVALYFVLAPAHLVGTRLGFILAYTLLGLPYVVVLFIAGLRRFDRSLEMAAASLGAKPFTVLRTVTLPLLVPTIASAFLFAFIVGFDDVVFGLFLSGAGATPLPIRMWDNIRLEISPQIAVVAVLLFALLALGYVFYLAAGSFARLKRQT
jgi:putative spermidine/putrescine transport system permease protein